MANQIAVRDAILNIPLREYQAGIGQTWLERNNQKLERIPEVTQYTAKTGKNELYTSLWDPKMMQTPVEQELYNNAGPKISLTVGGPGKFADFKIADGPPVTGISLRGFSNFWSAAAPISEKQIKDLYKLSQQHQEIIGQIDKPTLDFQIASVEVKSQLSAAVDLVESGASKALYDTLETARIAVKKALTSLRSVNALPGDEGRERRLRLFESKSRGNWLPGDEGRERRRKLFELKGVKLLGDEGREYRRQLFEKNRLMIEKAQKDGVKKLYQYTETMLVRAQRAARQLLDIRLPKPALPSRLSATEIDAITKRLQKMNPLPQPTFQNPQQEMQKSVILANMASHTANKDLSGAQPSPMAYMALYYLLLKKLQSTWSSNTAASKLIKKYCLFFLIQIGGLYKALYGKKLPGNVETIEEKTESTASSLEPVGLSQSQSQSQSQSLNKRTVKTTHHNV